MLLLAERSCHPNEPNQTPMPLRRSVQDRLYRPFTSRQIRRDVVTRGAGSTISVDGTTRPCRVDRSFAINRPATIRAPTAISQTASVPAKATSWSPTSAARNARNGYVTAVAPTISASGGPSRARSAGVSLRAVGRTNHKTAATTT